MALDSIYEDLRFEFDIDEHVETSLPPVHAANRRMRMIVCRHWLKGLCQKGDYCEVQDLTRKQRSLPCFPQILSCTLSVCCLPAVSAHDGSGPHADLQVGLCVRSEAQLPVQAHRRGGASAMPVLRVSACPGAMQMLLDGSRWLPAHAHVLLESPGCCNTGMGSAAMAPAAGSGTSSCRQRTAPLKQT